MKIRFVTLALAAFAPGAPAQENVQAPLEIDLPQQQAAEEEGPTESEPAPAPWDGTFAQGMAEVVRLAASEEPGAAIEVCDRLLEDSTFAGWRSSLETRTGGWSERVVRPLQTPLTWLGFETMDGADRAEVRYARGLLHARTGAMLSAEDDLELARVLAGEGATRSDATYALGTLDLLLGEQMRQKIPEISGAQPVPGNPTAPGLPGAPVAPAAPGTGEEAPDPIELARAAYEAARGHFVDRLRLDWRDADTRANVELVQRRLRELDEIERQREQQQQEQQQNEDQQEQEQEQESDSNQEGEEQESDDESQDQEQQDPQDQEEQEEPSESDESEDESEEEQESGQEEQEGEPEERYLTQEEMQRLLEALRQYTEEGEELKKALQGVRRERVERDW